MKTFDGLGERDDSLKYQCDGCGKEFSVEHDEGRRLEVEGKKIDVCNDCIADKIVDCEHALVEAYDHFIWREHAHDAGDGEMVCHAELIARITAQEVIG